MARRLRAKLITFPWELEVPTLTLASIAAVTPPEIEVSIVDTLREPLFLDEEVDLVGISASTPAIDAAYAVADEYRAKGVKVVFGGHHATAMPEEALRHADAVVVAEGEPAWRKICEQLLTDPSQIGGIYREAECDLATLPQPRVDLMKWDRYSLFYYPIIGSRGCPEKCSFCFSKRVTKMYRTYPIEHVLEQVRRRPAGTRSMYFVDDNLPGDLDWVRELFRALAKEKIPFGMQARHEFLENPSDLELAKQAGCTLISSGYESVNQMTLDKTGKKATAEGYIERIKNVFDVGIIPSGNWMFGFDWDGPEIFDETLRFLDRSHLMHSSFTTEIPFPGTPAFTKYDKEGRLLTKDYRRYRGKDEVVVRPKLMSPEQLQRGIRKLALDYYSPRRSAKRTARALGNPRIGDAWGSLVRGPSMVALEAYQLWQWHYRMAPPVQSLYRRMLPLHKYRYVRDWLTRSNFAQV